MEFSSELKKLGLTDKEAFVYLACLELGPSPVQVIARKAKVVRATTYVILGSLLLQGLVTKFEKGKKTLFSAEPPNQLLRLLEKQQEAIVEKQHDLKLLLPELQVLMKRVGERPSVRYFEGKEGLHHIRQEINMYMQPGDIIYNFTPADHLTAIFPDSDEISYPQRVARGIYAKTIFTTKSESLKKRWLSEEFGKLSQRRYVSPNKFPSPAGMTIYGDRIALGSFTGKLVGVVIESQPIADMMRALFHLAWEDAASSYSKNS